MTITPSQTLLLAWEIAASEAATVRSTYIEPEHFFIGLCRLQDYGTLAQLRELGYDQPSAERIQPEIESLTRLFYHFGIDPITLRREIRSGKGTGILQRLGGLTTGTLRLGRPQSDDGVMHRSTQSRQVFARAIQVAEGRETTILTVAHLLAALLEHAPSSFTTLLRQRQINLHALREAALTQDVA
jgi:ATP-dependent Clp protease ATP-binding subunit ClpA